MCAGVYGEGVGGGAPAAELTLPSVGRVSSDRGMSIVKLPPRATQLRLLRFFAVGAGSALAQVGIIVLLKPHLRETLAFSISWICSSALHYLANRFWALPSGRSDAGKQFFEYLFTLFVSYAINLGAFFVCRNWIGMGVEWATLWAIPPSTIVVFLFLNYRVFRAPEAQRS